MIDHSLLHLPCEGGPGEIHEIITFCDNLHATIVVPTSQVNSASARRNFKSSTHTNLWTVYLDDPCTTQKKVVGSIPIAPRSSIVSPVVTFDAGTKDDDISSLNKKVQSILKSVDDGTA